MRDTIDLAREAGIEFQRNTGALGKETISTMGSQRIEWIERLVALVRADEREACAKICDDLHPGIATNRAAELIRARGQK
jgi:hypothetical protein